MEGTYLEHRQKMKLGLIAPSEKKKVPLKRSEKPIAKISEKENKRLKEYKPVRKQFLKDNPVCQIRLPGCTIESTEIHHQSGRSGKKLVDVDDFLAVCFNCHRRAHDQDEASRQNGILKTRITPVKK